ncbi:MAG: HAD-IA family hydrolase [Paludibacteraceae bacterium]|nr:HAD-IA family hydrolase [Paludibacteraceae bacterium]
MMKSFQAYFFDMDGTLFDSMPHHSQAWETVMRRHGLDFTAYDCYLNEGRTGQDVIHEAIWTKEHREASEEEIWSIYNEKTEEFHRLGGAKPIPGVKDLLELLVSQGTQVWIVTGSGQQTLFDTLDESFPGIFTRKYMITALDVVHGKPHPEPYLRAWERCGLPKEECCVIENAPLGIQSGKAAGLFTIGVNTGILRPEDLLRAGADHVYNNMAALREAIIEAF